MRLDDRELFERVARGADDAPTWSAFVSRFSRLCYHAIHRVISKAGWTTPCDADELFQRLFEYILAHDRAALRRYRGDNGCSPATYLSHLAAFQALEFIREHGRAARERAWSDARSARNGRTHIEARGVEEELVRQEAVEQVRRALKRLSTTDQQLFELHYRRGMSLVEVARVLSKSETAVHVQHHRFKERLRKALGAEQAAGQPAG